jgi:hypothetical protein
MWVVFVLPNTPHILHENRESEGEGWGQYIVGFVFFAQAELMLCITAGHRIELALSLCSLHLPPSLSLPPSLPPSLAPSLARARALSLSLALSSSGSLAPSNPLSSFPFPQVPFSLSPLSPSLPRAHTHTDTHTHPHTLSFSPSRA